MQDRNPYASPRAQVADSDGDQEYGEIKIFSAQGRLGRVRFLGYGVASTVLFSIVMGIAAAAAGPNALVAVAIVGYLAIFVVSILLTIQRAHDFNSSGWLSLLVFVPLVSLIFLFIPGTRGENRFGKRPPPNTVGVIVLACVLPLVFILGILAAIAIPAYQDYTIRAQISEGLNLAAAVKAGVAEAYLRTDAAPVDRVGAGLTAAATDTGGKYVESVDVANGTIVVTYGAAANAAIAGKFLALQPYVTADKSVVWRCGKASAAPAGAVAMDADAPAANRVTDIEPRYLPSLCRP